MPYYHFPFVSSPPSSATTGPTSGSVQESMEDSRAARAVESWDKLEGVGRRRKTEGEEGGGGREGGVSTTFQSWDERETEGERDRKEERKKERREQEDAPAHSSPHRPHSAIPHSDASPFHSRLWQSCNSRPYRTASHLPRLLGTPPPLPLPALSRPPMRHHLEHRECPRSGAADSLQPQ